jgi:pimeloyl-ACP methyl ester carboxylesterase
LWIELKEHSRKFAQGLMVIQVSGSRLRAEMHAEFIEHHNSLIHYHFAERGHRLIVCFHGYDENGLSFDLMQEVFPVSCSLLAIDLPHHGKTEWNDALRFDPGMLWDLISSICKKHGRNNLRIELAGFSMGGRIALSLLDYRPEHIDRMILLAPDGLRNNYWYWLSTSTVIGQKIFAITVRNPGWFLFTLRVANKLKIINPAVFKFSWFYLKEAGTRNLLYKRWMAMRWMRPDLKTIKKQIQNRDIPVLLIYGAYDRIMPAEAGLAFCRDTHDLCKVELLPCGHQIMQLKNKKNLSKIFRRLRF